MVAGRAPEEWVPEAGTSRNGGGMWGMWGMKGGTAGNALRKDMFVSRSCFVESAGALTLLLVYWFVDSFAALSYAQSLEVARIRGRRCVVSGRAQHSSLRCQSALRFVVASGGFEGALCGVRK